MNPRLPFGFTLTIGIAVALLSTANAAAAGGVSPGALERFAVSRDSCPTFSWEATPGADAFELVAFALPKGLEPDQVLDQHLTAGSQVLYERLPGGATAWTPAADQCLAPGGRYAWFVRARSADGPSEWSAGRYFAVPFAPTALDVQRALEVLQRYAAASGELDAEVVTATAPQHAVTARTASAAPTGGLKSVPTAEAAIRGDRPDASGEAYGVVGTTASAQGAGLGAANTAGGPDLVLDGSADGQADTLLRQSGLDRPSPTNQRFTLQNSGAGTLDLQVEGSVTATSFAGDGSGLTGISGTLPCSGCVGSTEIADGVVTGADIADETVTFNNLQDNSVGTDKLALNAVTSNRILNGTITFDDLAASAVTMSKIADGAVWTSKIADGNVTTAKLTDGAVTTAKIADAAVTSAKITDAAVTSAKIAVGAVDYMHIASGAVRSTQILDGMVMTNDLANGAVTTAKIADSAVTWQQILNNTITTSKLALNVIGTAQIADGAITAADVNPSGGIYSSKSAVYVATTAQPVPSLTCGTITVACADANDLPLQGVCDTPAGNNVDVRRTDFDSWDSTASSSSYLCEVCNNQASSLTVNVHIACIAVP